MFFVHAVFGSYVNFTVITLVPKILKCLITPLLYCIAKDTVIVPDL